MCTLMSPSPSGVVARGFCPWGRPILAFVSFCCALCLGAVHAMAQAPVRTLVVEIGTEESPSLDETHHEQLRRAAVDAFATVHQAPTFMGPSDRSRLAAVSGVAPTPVPRGQVSRLQGTFNQVLEAVALGENRRALRLANRAVFPRRGRWLADLGSDSIAETLGDICLFSVRALQQLGQPEEAFEQAGRCLDLVPDLRASSRWHPEEVRALVTRAKRQPTERLLFQADVDGPCVYSVGGRPLKTDEAAVRGTEVVVGVRCAPDEATHWFPVVVAATPEQALTFPVRFARAARLGKYGLTLRYPSDASRLLHGEEDVKRAAVSLHASHVMVVQATADRRVHVSHLLRSDVASLDPVKDGILNLSDTAEVTAFLTDNLSTLKQAQIEAAVSEPEVEAPAAQPTVAPVRRGEDQVSSAAIVGWSLAGTGLAAYGAGWFLYTRWLDQDRTAGATPADSDARDSAVTARNRTSLIAAITAAAGGLILTSSVPLTLPSADTHGARVPYWSWALGGLGLGALGGGLYVLSTEGRCASTDCGRTRRKGPLGVLLVAGAAPLIAIPITHALRAPESTHVAFAPLIERARHSAVLGGASLHFRGVF